jgi:hypothetical protein
MLSNCDYNAFEQMISLNKTVQNNNQLIFKYKDSKNINALNYFVEKVDQNINFN